jgi:hypothetical protein
VSSRRARYRPPEGELAVRRTPNGSAVAVVLTLIAMVENKQEDGTVSVPSSYIYRAPEIIQARSAYGPGVSRLENALVSSAWVWEKNEMNSLSSEASPS